MNISIEDNGSLKITVSDEEAEQIREERGFKTDMDVLNRLLEPYWTNGQYYLFDAGQGNPFVGLTDAPCIAEGIEISDAGDRTVIGNLWYFDAYALKDMIEELADNRELEFTLVGDPEPVKKIGRNFSLKSR